MSPAQYERLAVLSEELGEVQQVIGKILRHGYETTNPLEQNGRTNRQKLEMELGDLLLVLYLMDQEGDIYQDNLSIRMDEKTEKLNSWLHYNKVYK